MRQIRKRVLACTLTMAMMFCLFPVMTQAATKNMTMYVGETVLVYPGKPIAKISNTNGKVVQVKREEPDHIYATLVAAKTGKSKVTMKTGSGTAKINVTVKKADISIKVLADDSSDSYVYLAVSNKTSKFFEQALIEYTIKDTEGVILKKDTTRVFNLPAKTVTPMQLYLDVEDAKSVRLSDISAKVVGLQNDVRNRYVDASSKIKVNIKNKFEKSKEITGTLCWNNTSNQAVSLSYYAMVYDSKNRLIAMTSPTYMMLKAGQSNVSDSYSGLQIPKPKGYHHYKLVKSAYYVKFAPKWI